MIATLSTKGHSLDGNFETMIFLNLEMFYYWGKNINCMYGKTFAIYCKNVV